MIKAIETEYKGYKFRSRIEARWAIFFDTVGIKYEYEKEGYDLDGVWYLPDFWLPELETWVEIKGKKPTKEEENKCHKLAKLSNKRVFLLYGEIPYSEDKIIVKNGENIGDFIDGWQKVLDNFVMYVGEGGCDYPYMFCECPDCGNIGIEFDGRSDRLKCKNKGGCPTHSPNDDKHYNYCSKKIIKGYKKARGYRF